MDYATYSTLLKKRQDIIHGISLNFHRLNKLCHIYKLKIMLINIDKEVIKHWEKGEKQRAEDMDWKPDILTPEKLKEIVEDFLCDYHH